MSKIIHYSPQLVWRVIGDPARVDWVPGVEACAYDGEVRRFTMTGAGEVVERIFLVDDAARRIEYGVIESSAEIDHHRASIQVNPFYVGPQIGQPSGSRVVWEVTVAPQALEPFIEERMRLALVELNRVMEQELHNATFS